jgi:dipeptide/tripeptide permease
LTNVAQKTIVMDKASCTSDYGSNFTLQASLAQIGGIFSMMAAPMLSQWLGYPAVLALGGVLGLISAVLLMRYRHL